MCLIRRSCLPCYVENLDIESMFIEVRRLMNFISDENVIAGLHVVEGYALARRQMFDRAAQAVSNALHLLDKAKATTPAMIRAAALHVKSLCDDGSIQLQRESQNQVLRNDFILVVRNNKRIISNQQ